MRFGEVGVDNSVIKMQAEDQIIEVSGADQLSHVDYDEEFRLSTSMNGHV